MGAATLSEDLTVADVLARWPETVPVFMSRRMGCVGCCMAPFETLSEAAEAYGLCPRRLVRDLRSCLDGGTVHGPKLPHVTSPVDRPV